MLAQEGWNRISLCGYGQIVGGLRLEGVVGSNDTEREGEEGGVNERWEPRGVCDPGNPTAWLVESKITRVYDGPWSLWVSFLSVMLYEVQDPEFRSEACGHRGYAGLDLSVQMGVDGCGGKERP